MKKYLTEKVHFSNGRNGFNSTRGEYYGPMLIVVVIGFFVMIWALNSI